MKDGVIVQEGTAEEILTNPANDYVARFVEDVDMSKVITAEIDHEKIRSDRLLQDRWPQVRPAKDEKSRYFENFRAQGSAA